MATIPQRELRNNISEVLRRAEAGERFTITVSGRPVARLGPVADDRRVATAADLHAILDTPVDAAWAGELLQMREEERADARDPWTD